VLCSRKVWIHILTTVEVGTKEVINMTSKELVENLLKRKKTERIGLFEIIWPDTLRNWINEGYPAKANDTCNEMPVDPVEHFKFDMARVGNTFDLIPLLGVSDVLEETDEWIVTRNGAGAALKNWKHKSGTPEHIDFLMTSREVWERDYRPHLLHVDRKRFNLQATAEALKKYRAMDRWVCFNSTFIWETMRGSLGDVCMYENLALDQDWIHDFNRVYTDFFKAHYRIIFEEVGKPDGIWLSEDIAYKNGLFCSPGLLEELIFPYYKEIIDFFHSYDLPVILHSCGRVDEALHMIVDAGFDVLHPMEINAGCEPLKYAEKYGDKLTFIGGFNKMILETGDKELIKQEIVWLIEGMKSLGASYFFSSDHSISTNVTYEAYKYALDVYREYMSID
jgi:uroporphyrinogen decarboxylase